MSLEDISSIPSPGALRIERRSSSAAHHAEKTQSPALHGALNSALLIRGVHLNPEAAHWICQLDFVCLL